MYDSTTGRHDSSVIRAGLLLALACSISVHALAEQRPLTLVANGESEYVILPSADASPSEKWAAEELASHLRQMSGATLEVETEGESLPPEAILIGDSHALRSLGVGKGGRDVFHGIGCLHGNGQFPAGDAVRQAFV